MLVRKIKCPSCGGYKINNISTAYIYCDYCSSLMGYDVDMMQSEAREIFSPENMQKPAQQNFIKASQQLNEAIQKQDAEAFLSFQIQMHKAEFEMYEKRFSPKMKQPAYTQKFLEFYEKYWAEQLENDYFQKQADTQKLFAEASEPIKTSYENGKYRVEYNDDFIRFLDVIKNYTEKSVDETMNMKAMAYYPEGIDGATRDTMIKQSAASAILQYDEDTVKKSLEYLGLQNEFIDAEPPQTSETECVLCNAKLTIPEGANHIICESCGSPNSIKTGMIQCHGCGAEFDPTDSDACEYCGAKIIRVGNTPTPPPETNSKQENQEANKKKKGFFGKWFS